MTVSQSLASPADIHSELTRIWDSLEGTGKMRASLFNLIFYTQKNERAPYIRNIARKVVEKFPSRVILVSADQASKESYLKASVFVLPASKGDSDIACDMIEVEASGDQLMRVPFVILPHILPDLPIYMIWADDPTKPNALCFSLEKFASRLIFDSETSSNLPAFAKAVLAQREKTKADIADLNWARLETWRDVITNTFHSQERLQQLYRTKSIQITFNSQETEFFCHTSTQAVYLQGWLASQLGWKFHDVAKQNSGFKFVYLKDNQQIDVSVKSANLPQFAPGSILNMDLVTENDEHHFAFARNLQASHQITVTHSTPTSCDMPSNYIFTKGESGQSLVKEITHKRTSQHYLNVLNLVANMDKLTQCIPQ